MVLGKYILFFVLPVAPLPFHQPVSRFSDDKDEKIDKLKKKMVILVLKKHIFALEKELQPSSSGSEAIPENMPTQRTYTESVSEADTDFDRAPVFR